MNLAFAHEQAHNRVKNELKTRFADLSLSLTCLLTDGISSVIDRQVLLMTDQARASGACPAIGNDFKQVSEKLTPIILQTRNLVDEMTRTLKLCASKTPHDVSETPIVGSKTIANMATHDTHPLARANPNDSTSL